jgi:hypothetical protein
MDVIKKISMIRSLLASVCSGCCSKRLCPRFSDKRNRIVYSRGAGLAMSFYDWTYQRPLQRQTLVYRRLQGKRQRGEASASIKIGIRFTCNKQSDTFSCQLSQRYNWLTIRRRVLFRKHTVVLNKHHTKTMVSPRFMDETAYMQQG